MDFFIFHFDWPIAILVNTVAPSDIMKRHFSDQSINKHWLVMCFHRLTSKNKPVRLYLQYSLGIHNFCLAYVIESDVFCVPDN